MLVDRLMPASTSLMLRSPEGASRSTHDASACRKRNARCQRHHTRSGVTAAAVAACSRIICAAAAPAASGEPIVWTDM